ncbi:MAG: hypothetical protein OEZ43_06480 [Gammaproteobacteria bacterium]|nr:hypothetical protein [Gammaproteobacteria bacterium]
MGKDGAPPGKLFNKSSILKGLLAVSGVGLLGIVALHIALLSGGLTGPIVSIAQSSLSDAGVTGFQAKNISVDLFGDVDLDEIALEWKDAQLGNASVALSKVEVRYSLLPILFGNLDIERVEVSGLKVTGNIALLPAQEDGVEEEASPPMELAEIEQLLSEPPLNIRLQQLLLSDFQFQIKLHDAQQTLDYSGTLDRFEVQLNWDEQRLEGMTTLSMGKQGQDSISLAYASGGESMAAHVLIRLQADAQWSLVRDERNWRLSLPTLKLLFSLSDLDIDQPNRPDVGKMGALKTEVNASLNSVDSSGHEGLLSLFPLDTNIHIRNQVDQLKVDKLSVDDMYLDTELVTGTDMTIKGQLHPFDEPTPQVSIDVDHRLDIPFLTARMGKDQLTLDRLHNIARVQANNSQGAQSGPVQFSVSTLLDIDAFKGDIKSEKTFVAFKEHFSFSGEGRLKSFDDIPQQLDMSGRQALAFSKVKLNMVDASGSNKIDIPELQLNTNLSLNEGRVKIDGKLGLAQAQLPELLKRVNIQLPFAVDTRLDAEASDVQLSLSLDKSKLFDAKIKTQNEGGILSVHHDIGANAPKRLTAYSALLADLKTIGGAELTIKGDARVHHGAAALLDADFSQADRMRVETAGNIEISQTSKPTAEQGSIFLEGKPQIIYAVQNGEQIALDMRVLVPGIKTEPLEKYVEVDLQVQQKMDAALKKIASKINLALDGKQAVIVDGTVNNDPGKLQAALNVQASVYQRWHNIMADFKDLEQTGDVNTRLDIKTTLTHDKDNITEIEPDKLNSLQLGTDISLAVSQIGNTDKAVLVMREPITFTGRLDWSPEQAHFDGRYAINKTTLDNSIDIKQMSGSIRALAKDGLEPAQIEFDFDLDKSEIAMLDGDQRIQLDNLITPIKTRLRAGQRGDLLVLDSLRNTVGSNHVDTHLSGQINLSTLDGQFQLNNALTFSPDMLSSPALAGSGQIRTPVIISIVEGDKVSLDGALEFEQVKVQIDDMSVGSMNGRIKLEEELILGDEYVQFRYVDEIDPFQRVDYNAFQPFVDSDHLKIDQIHIDNLDIGPMHAQSSIKQNLIRFPDFNLKIFDGFVTGQLFFDARPGNWKFGLLSRVSNVDPRFLLDPKSRMKQSERSPVNARTAVLFDFNRRLLEGRINVSDINKQQLLQLIEFIDPNHEDEQLALVRKAVRTAHPEWVSIDMSQGLMNLQVKMSLIPTPIEIRRLPLSGLIQQYAGDTLDEFRTIPLQ